MSTAVFPVHAAGETSDTAECIDESLYHQFTIDFAATPYTIQSSEENTAFSKNKANVNSAINFVQSLDLADQGYEYIEESCLTQLYDFAGMEDFTLNSYTVLVPKTNALNPIYFGTYNGFTFYSAYYSTYDFQIVEDTSKIGASKISSFVSGALDWIVNFSDDTLLSFSYTLLCQLTGDSNYHVSEKDEFMHRYYGSGSCRGIYTKSGSTYTRYYSSESGRITSELHFMPVSGPTEIENYGSKYVTMPNFNNKTFQMQQAYNWIIGTGTEFPERHYIADYVGKLHLG